MLKQVVNEISNTTQIPANNKEGKRTRRKNIVVKIHIAKDTFNINVGDGSQTFKWLATVAVNRYKIRRCANGRFRQRKVLYHISDTGTLTPRSIDTLDTKDVEEEIVKPSTLVKDVVVKQGTELWVELDNPVALNHRKEPERSHWQSLAFAYNDKTVRLRDANETARIKLISSKKKRHEHMKQIRLKLAAKLGADKARGGVFSKVLSMDPATLFKQDWSKLNLTMYTIANQKSMKELLQSYFQEIRDIFKLYATSGGKTSDINLSSFTMSAAEYSQFIHDAKILNILRDEKVWMKSYFGRPTPYTNNGRRSGASGGTGRKKGVKNGVNNNTANNKSRNYNQISSEEARKEIVRYEFLECLMRLATLKYGRSSVLSRQSSDYDNQSVNNTSVAGQLQLLIYDFILPFHKDLNIGISRTLLYTDKTMNIIQNHLDDLRSVFEVYADDSNSSPSTSQTSTSSVSYHSYIQMCEKYNLLGAFNKEKQQEQQKNKQNNAGGLHKAKGHRSPVPPPSTKRRGASNPMRNGKNNKRLDHARALKKRKHRDKIDSILRQAFLDSQHDDEGLIKSQTEQNHRHIKLSNTKTSLPPSSPPTVKDISANDGASSTASSTKASKYPSSLQKKSPAVSEFTGLEFPEFIEAIMRLGVERFTPGGINHYDINDDGGKAPALSTLLLLSLEEKIGKQIEVFCRLYRVNIMRENPTL